MLLIISKQRDEIIDKLCNFKIKSVYYDTELFTKILSVQPSYTIFFELYNDIIKSTTLRSIETQIINAYNLGYSKSLDNNKYNKVYSYFIKLIDNINQYKEINDNNQQTNIITKNLKNTQKKSLI